MKIGMELVINGIDHTILYIDETEGSNTAILIPKRMKGELPSFMAVKNIRPRGDSYTWDDVFYTEDLGNACIKCDHWTHMDGQY